MLSTNSSRIKSYHLRTSIVERVEYRYRYSLGTCNCEAPWVAPTRPCLVWCKWFKCEPNKITRLHNTSTLTELQILNALNDIDTRSLGKLHNTRTLIELTILSWRYIDNSGCDLFRNGHALRGKTPTEAMQFSSTSRPCCRHLTPMVLYRFRSHERAGNEIRTLSPSQQK